MIVGRSSIPSEPAYGQLTVDQEPKVIAKLDQVIVEQKTFRSKVQSVAKCVFFGLAVTALATGGILLSVGTLGVIPAAVLMGVGASIVFSGAVLYCVRRWRDSSSVTDNTRQIILTTASGEKKEIEVNNTGFSDLLKTSLSRNISEVSFVHTENGQEIEQSLEDYSIQQKLNWRDEQERERLAEKFLSDIWNSLSKTLSDEEKIDCLNHIMHAIDSAGANGTILAAVNDALLKAKLEKDAQGFSLFINNGFLRVKLIIEPNHRPKIELTTQSIVPTFISGGVFLLKNPYQYKCTLLTTFNEETKKWEEKLSGEIVKITNLDLPTLKARYLKFWNQSLVSLSFVGEAIEVVKGLIGNSYQEMYGMNVEVEVKREEGSPTVKYILSKVTNENGESAKPYESQQAPYEVTIENVNGCFSITTITLPPLGIYN